MRTSFVRCARRAPLWVLPLAVWLGGCSSAPPVTHAARRGEESVEQPAPSVADAAPSGGESGETPVAGTRRVTAAPADHPPVPLSALARRATGGSRSVLFYVDDLDFAPGASGLDADARAVLDRLAERLRRVAGTPWLEVQGHADASGGDRSNLYLALQRAEAVRTYLVRSCGVPRDHVAVVSLGAGRPAASNSTPQGRARNRRAVVLVLR